MKISESFYSVQGEGITQGIPSYFIRLQGCNLMCGGKNAEKLVSGKATWYCDTELVWRRGEGVSNEQLLERFKASGQLENILSGQTHLIWTGGEPTLEHHRQDITKFVQYLHSMNPNNKAFHELETNGTIKVEPFFYSNIITQINASPKLSNSGESYERRVNPDAIKQIVAYPNSYFKFVVSNESDLREAMLTYIKPFEIPRDKVLLQPACDSMLNLPYATKNCYEMTKNYGFRTVTRGHIVAWNKTTGV